MKFRIFITLLLAEALGLAATAASRDSSRTFTIAMTGDIMMGTTYPTTQLPPDDGKHLFDDAKDVLASADIAAGNLEGTLCDSGSSTKGNGKYSYAFRTPVRFAPRLKEAGFDFLCQANNHANDFGAEGITSTEKALNELGIEYSGIKEHKSWAIIERDSVKFGLCAFGHNSYTLKHQDLATVKAILDTLKAQADIIIVAFHGGAEGTSHSHLPQGKETFLGEDRGSLRQFAHFCIDNGADVIYGHGPHVVRCVEVYKGRFIAYSLGNFCTPYGINVSGISGYAPVIEAKIDGNGKFLSGQIHSFIQVRGVGPRKDTLNKVSAQIRSLTLADVPHSGVVIGDDGAITLKAEPANPKD